MDKEEKAFARMVNGLSAPMREAMVSEYRQQSSRAALATINALVDRGLMEWDQETADINDGHGWILSDMGYQVAAHFAKEKEA